MTNTQTIKLRPVKSALATLALYTSLTWAASGALVMTAQAEDTHMDKMEKVEMMKSDHMMAETLASGDFIRKNKTLKGSYSVVQENGQTIIRFADNFKASRGPDLKVFISPKDFDSVTGRNATQDSVLLGFVKSNKGTQDYIVPEGVNISSFNSVLVHCEQFSVLWGGGNI